MVGLSRGVKRELLSYVLRRNTKLKINLLKPAAQPIFTTSAAVINDWLVSVQAADTRAAARSFDL